MAKAKKHEAVKIGQKVCPQCMEILGRTKKICSECGYEFGKGHSNKPSGGKFKIPKSKKAIDNHPALKKKTTAKFRRFTPLKDPLDCDEVVDTVTKNFKKVQFLRATQEKIKELEKKHGHEFKACPACDAIYVPGTPKCFCGHILDLRGEKSLAMKDILDKVTANMIDGGALKMKHITEKEMYKDPWQHRSEGMTCKTCMWVCNFRCRKRAPTMDGYPAVYSNDWCGDHKLAKEDLS